MVDDVSAAGVAYLFNVSSGELLRTIRLNDPQFNTVFGHVTRIDGTTILIGALGVDDFGGGVFVFEVREPSAGLLAGIGAASLLFIRPPSPRRLLAILAEAEASFSGAV